MAGRQAHEVGGERIGDVDDGVAARVTRSPQCRRGNNGDIICAAAVDGLGVVLQPTFLVYELLRTKRLVRILEDYEPDAFTIFAVYPSRQFLTPKVRTFIDFLVERFGASPYWDQAIF